MGTKWDCTSLPIRGDQMTIIYLIKHEHSWFLSPSHESISSQSTSPQFSFLHGDWEMHCFKWWLFPPSGSLSEDIMMQAEPASCLRRLCSVTKKSTFGEFPSGPGVKTWPFHYEGPGSIPGQGTKILQVLRCGQKNLQNQKKKKKPKTKKTHTKTHPEIHFCQFEPLRFCVCLFLISTV